MASVPLTLVLGIVIGYPVLFSGLAGVLAFHWWAWTPDQRDSVLGRGRWRS